MKSVLQATTPSEKKIYLIWMLAEDENEASRELKEKKTNTSREERNE